MMQVLLSFTLFLIVVHGQNSMECEQVFKDERKAMMKETKDLVAKEMKSTQDKMEYKIEALQSTIETMKDENREQELKIKEQQSIIEKMNISMEELRDPPVFYQCGFKGAVGSTANTVINYDSLYYSRSNQWTEEGGLDPSSGLFISPYSGTYSFTYSLMAWTGTTSTTKGYDTQIYLRLNGEDVPESYHRSHTGGDGYSYDQGGRTLVTHLARGDTVELHCKECRPHGLYNVVLM